MAPLFARGSDDRTSGRRWPDRIVGIVVGIVLGLGVLIYFVFVHSEGTIDAPKVNESGTATTGSGSSGASTRPGSAGEPGTGEAGASAGGGKRGGAGGSPTPGGERQGAPSRKPVPVVEVIGGAPPTATGPRKLTFHKGEKVRFEIKTSEPFSFEIRGLGVTESIEQSSIISFPARKVGQFPVIAMATLIGVADLTIKPKK